MSSIFWIYDYLLGKKIKKHDLPDHIGVILNITEFKKENIDKFLNWCSEFEIDKVSIYISIKDSKDTKKLEEKIKNIQNTQNKKNNLIDKIPKKKLDKEKKTLNTMFQ